MLLAVPQHAQPGVNCVQSLSTCNKVIACRSLEGVQSSFAQLNAVKEQMEGAHAALRRVDTSKLAEGSADGKA